MIIKRLMLSAAMVAILSGCATTSSVEPTAPPMATAPEVPSTKPTPAEAKAFVEDAEKSCRR